MSLAREGRNSIVRFLRLQRQDQPFGYVGVLKTAKAVERFFVVSSYLSFRVFQNTCREYAPLGKTAFSLPHPTQTGPRPPPLHLARCRMLKGLHSRRFDGNVCDVRRRLSQNTIKEDFNALHVPNHPLHQHIPQLSKRCASPNSSPQCSR